MRMLSLTYVISITMPTTIATCVHESYSMSRQAILYGTLMDPISVEAKSPLVPPSSTFNALPSIHSHLPLAGTSPFPHASQTRMAMFPLVDVEVSSRGTTDFSVGKIRRENSCSAGSNDRKCSTSLAGAVSTDAAMRERDGNGLASTVGSGSGFPLAAFLRVELVGLDEAEVTFRPGESRREALFQELANRRAAEQYVCYFPPCLSCVVEKRVVYRIVPAPKACSLVWWMSCGVF